MTARKQIKKQHRLHQEEQRRAFERSRRRRRLLESAPPEPSPSPQSLPSVSLSLGDNLFRPDTLNIKAGQKYRLEVPNQGINTHHVWFAGPDNQSSTGDNIRSEPISGGSGADLKIKCDKPGCYYFVCTFYAGEGCTPLVQLAITMRPPKRRRGRQKHNEGTMKAREIMMRPVIAASKTTWVRDVAMQMLIGGFSGMPVAERDGALLAW